MWMKGHDSETLGLALLVPTAYSPETDTALKRTLPVQHAVEWT